MNKENDVKEKQEFLRIHILEKGYDADEFMEFLENLKGEKGLKIENWSKNDLIAAVEQFTKMKPNQNNIVQINDNNIEENNNKNNNNEEINKEINVENENNKIKNASQLFEQEFLQCKLNERNGISDEKNLIIKISQPKIVEGNFFTKSYLTYLVETNPFGFQVRRRFNDFLWLHDILKSLYINAIIPPLNKKSYLYTMKEAQIAKRIRTLEKFIREIAAHPLLRNSQIFYDFITMRDEKDFIRKKDDYNKISLPKNAEDIKTITGEINISINYDKEQYADKIKSISEINEDMMKRMIKEYKYLNVQLQNVITKIKKINNIWDEFYKNSNKNLEGEIILGVYYSFSKFMENWTKLYQDQINLINEKIREYFRYIRNEYHSIKDYYTIYETAKNSYKKLNSKLTETKERLFEEKKIDDWGLDREDLENKILLFRNKELSMEKMLPEETKKVKDKKKMYGTYLNSLIDEYELIKNLNRKRHKENVESFIKEMSNSTINFHVSLNELIGYIDTLKEDLFINEN